MPELILTLVSGTTGESPLVEWGELPRAGAVGAGAVVQDPAEIIVTGLPDMPGEEVLQRLQADPRTKGTRIVVVSADALPGQTQRLQAAGAVAYLTKPLDVAQFLELIDEVLREKTP